MLYDIYQNSRIRHARQTAVDAKSKAQKSQRDVENLEQKVEMLLMVTEALWAIVKKSHKLDDSYLSQVIEEIDLKDGKLDGKVGKTPPIKCSNCGKSITRGKTKCMYCGTKNEVQVFKR